MTPELQRLMKQARDYPNTATVDLLCAEIRRVLNIESDESYEASEALLRAREIRARGAA